MRNSNWILATGVNMLGNHQYGNRLSLRNVRQKPCGKVYRRDRNGLGYRWQEDKKGLAAPDQWWCSFLMLMHCKKSTISPEWRSPYTSKAYSLVLPMVLALVRLSQAIKALSDCVHETGNSSQGKMGHRHKTSRKAWEVAWHDNQSVFFIISWLIARIVKNCTSRQQAAAVRQAQAET